MRANRTSWAGTSLSGPSDTPLVIGLDDTWDTKDSHGHVRVSHTGSGSENKKFPLKSASYRAEYNQMLH